MSLKTRLVTKDFRFAVINQFIIINNLICDTGIRMHINNTNKFGVINMNLYVGVANIHYENKKIRDGFSWPYFNG